MKVMHLPRNPKIHPVMGRIGRLLVRHVLPTLFFLCLLAASMIMVNLYL